MFNLRVLCQDHPQRTIALVTTDHVLIFHYNATDTGLKAAPRCQVEFSDISSVELSGYRPLGAGYGTLGLITLNEDVFVCVVTGASQAATVRPGETVSRIDNVGFCTSDIPSVTIFLFSPLQIVSIDPSMNTAWTMRPVLSSLPRSAPWGKGKKW